MDNEEIKKNVDYCYSVIKSAQDQLSKLREECKHESIRIGKYMWAPGHIIDGKICNYCGEFINEIVVCTEYYNG
jgi:hypothetical protein